ncbi:hypothetical protein quinque_003932 [Culex quinquefasciatus]
MLRNFPNVCRLCLRTEPEQVMVPILDTVPEFGEQLSNLLDDFCSAAPEVAYARFKFDANVDSLRQLYENNVDYMSTVFCELGIINENEMLDWDALSEQKPDLEGIGQTTPANNNEAHKKSAHSRFMCANCYVTLKDEHSLKVHAKWHEGETIIPCFYCPMRFEAKDEYRLHLDTIHGANECHSCDTCGLQFKDVTALRSHLRSHADVRNFKCPDCDKTFKFRKDVVRHKKAVHANERFTCKYCSKSYVRNDKLRQHIERSHDLQTYFLCEICVKSFPTKEQLQEHKGHHAAPRAHQCATCMVTYPGKKELKAHQCITYRDDYVCCERDFKFHRHYNRHMFLAHGEKTNVRVKPDSMMKYKSRCKKCKVVFESIKLKAIHEKVCKKQEKAQKQVVTTYF